MGPFDWRGLVWLEDHDGEFNLRIKRKTKHEHPGVAGWAKRMGLGVHPVYLRQNGEIWDQPDGQRTYCYYWHPYKYKKDPVEFRKERQAKAATAAAASLPQNLVQYQYSYVSSGGSRYVPGGSLPATAASRNIQFFQYGPTPASTRKLDCDLSIVAPVVGWRRWSVDMFGCILKSNNGTKWMPYEKLYAVCKGGPSMSDPAGLSTDCKGIHCGCGIYAYKERGQSEVGENAPTTETHIWGEVYLWGRIVEHETGYRAQWAYPKSFINTGGIAEQLSVAYGVPLIPQEAPCTTK